MIDEQFDEVVVKGSKAHLLRYLQTLAGQSAASAHELPGFSMGVRRKLAR